MSYVLTFLQMAVAGFLFYSCFCRLVRTDSDTASEVRHAIWFLALAAGMVFGAPILPLLVPQIQWTPWTTPRWVWLALLIAVAFVQFVKARYWVSGTPSDFQKG
jgi:hypothetical protein